MTKPYIISPSILAANFSKLGQEIVDILEAGADRIHFDVMDNNFVPNLSFGVPILESLRKNGIDAFIDVHLMTNEVNRTAEEFIKAGANHITFHYEAVTHLDRTINHIKEQGVTVGLALCPATPISVLKPILHLLDQVLVMTVNPGFGGQLYIDYTTDKIVELKKLLMDKELFDQVTIQVDGGINEHTILKAALAGATNFVMGSALFHCNDYKNQIAKIRNLLNTI